MEIWKLRDEKSRQFTSFNMETKKKTLHALPRETGLLLDYKGPGIITRLWFTFGGWFFESWNPERTADPTILKKMILRIYWDGSDEPSVEAPLADFFGIGHCEYRHYLSKYIGMSSGGFYCYFPMPFNAVRITIQNLHESMMSHVFFNANYTELERLPENSGRFHCQFRTGRNEGSDPLDILYTEGKGHYAGCCLSMQGERMNNLSFLEAPEYIYLDGEERPSIVGTGLEDYFNGGWYFRDGEFYGPLHGVPLKDPLRAMVSMYRFHEDDAISFNKSIRMRFINPWRSDRLKPFFYSSTAYFYKDGATAAGERFPAEDELMALYRIRDADHQSIP